MRASHIAIKSKIQVKKKKKSDPIISVDRGLIVTRAITLESQAYWHSRSNFRSMLFYKGD